MKTSVTIEVEVEYNISPPHKGARDSCFGVANDDVEILEEIAAYLTRSKCITT